MRVLMVTPSYDPIIGGTETMVQGLSTKLNELRVHTDVLTFNMSKKWKPKWSGMTEKTLGTTVFRVPALDWLPITHSNRINLGINLIPGRFTHLLGEYDIIHFHEAEFSFPLFSFLVKKPKIMHLHSPNFNFFKRYYLSRLMLNHLTTLYFSINKQMKRELLRVGVHENRIVYFPNSVDTEVFYPGTGKKDDTLLYVGRLTSVKRLHVLLRSLDYVETPIKIKIIGPPGSNLEYLHELLRLIDIINRKGHHKVTYVGRVDRAQLAQLAQLIKWYQDATIFVCPSAFEPFGVVLLEAMACKTPVIGTNVGGIPEIVKDGENGILVPVDDYRKLAEAIQYLLDNKDIRVKFGNAGRKSVLENFSLGASAKKLSDIYEKILANS